MGTKTSRLKGHEDFAEMLVFEDASYDPASYDEALSRHDAS